MSNRGFNLEAANVLKRVVLRHGEPDLHLVRRLRDLELQFVMNLKCRGARGRGGALANCSRGNGERSGQARDDLAPTNARRALHTRRISFAPFPLTPAFSLGERAN